MVEVDTRSSEMQFFFSKLLDRNVSLIERVGGGRNSRVYRLTCKGSIRYAAKLYFLQGFNERDRLEVEFSSLRFLWKNGVRCIPRPIVADRGRGCGVYEYIEGKEIPSQQITGSDIDDAAQFLMVLKELKNRQGSGYLPIASEACFSVRAIVENIQSRLNRLFPLRSNEVQYAALRIFLERDFMPLFNEVTGWCKSNVRKAGIAFASDLSYEERTLNPADICFHNTLRRSNGQIVFLDFEHFGWDDPAKMVSNFLLHPGMRLSKVFQKRFLTIILKGFKEQKHLAKRVEIEYPLFGLKWCMILLNEFVPEWLRRREFADKNDLDVGDLRAKQLSKAVQMLQKIKKGYNKCLSDLA